MEYWIKYKMDLAQLTWALFFEIIMCQWYTRMPMVIFLKSNTEMKWTQDRVGSALELLWQWSCISFSLSLTKIKLWGQFALLLLLISFAFHCYANKTFCQQMPIRPHLATAELLNTTSFFFPPMHLHFKCQMETTWRSCV